jgi:hypothetical protein
VDIKPTTVHHIFHPATEFGDHFDEFDFFGMGCKYPAAFISYVEPTDVHGGCYLIWSGEDTAEAKDEAVNHATGLITDWDSEKQDD